MVGSQSIERVKSLSYYITPEDYAIAEQNGISKERVYFRVYVYNWSVKRAITQPLGRRNAWGWTENKHIAKQNGVGYRTYLDRVTAGWTQEEAASTPPLSYDDRLEKMAKAKKRIFTDEQISHAKANGVDHRKLWQRVKLLGWSVEEAISTPPLSNEESQRRARLANNTFRTMNETYWAEMRARKKNVTV